MKNRRWGMRVLVAGIWTIAMLTWGSIGYYLFGLPDLGPSLAVVAVAVVLAWPPLARSETEASATLSTPAETARPSRA